MPCTLGTDYDAVTGSVSDKILCVTVNNTFTIWWVFDESDSALLCSTPHET